METDLILCDTDVVIEYFNNNSELLQFLENLGIEKLIISSITRAEVQQGALDKNHLTKINNVLNKFPTLDIDDVISRRFNLLFEKYILSNKCSIPDILNAATAITYELPFFTLNIKDYHYLPEINLLPHTLKPHRKKM